MSDERRTTEHRLAVHFPKKKRQRKPKEPAAPTMFSFPSLGGSGCLFDLVQAYGGPTRVCKDFRLTRDLLDAWLTDRMEAPLTVLLALYWQGPDGMKHGFAESHWTHQYNSFRARRAEEKAALLEQVLVEITGQLGRDHPALAPVQKLLEVSSR